jgi:hypothetical protein
MLASRSGTLAMLTNLKVSLDIFAATPGKPKIRTSAQLTSSPGQPPEQKIQHSSRHLQISLQNRNIIIAHLISTSAFKTESSAYLKSSHL